MRLIRKDYLRLGDFAIPAVRWWSSEVETNGAGTGVVISTPLNDRQSRSLSGVETNMLQFRISEFRIQVFPG